METRKMTENHGVERLITGLGVREYFQDSVQTVLAQQRVKIADDTLVYLVNLLTGYLRAEALYDDTPDGRQIKPLVRLLAEALEAPSAQDTNRALQRLGDVALFISGLYATSLERGLVNIDYYIAMGGNAYRSLAGMLRGTFRGQVFIAVYSELAEKFPQLVDVLAEVGDAMDLKRDQDLLRLYEIWILTGSRHAERKLRARGIYPGPSAISQARH
jgi:hypothetical protein